MYAWARIETRKTLARLGEVGLGKKRQLGNGRLFFKVPSATEGALGIKGTDSWISDQSEGSHQKFGFSGHFIELCIYLCWKLQLYLWPSQAPCSPAGCLKFSWRAALPLPSLPAFLVGRRNFWLHFSCLEGGTSCIVWATAASCILHTKIKSLQMFGLSFAPEINLLVKGCVRRVWNSRTVLRSCFFYIYNRNAHQLTEF